MWTRREWLACRLAAPLWGASLRLGRSNVSAITDEIARTPADAIAFARQYGLQWVELRSVPGGGGTYAFLPEEKLREAARELSAKGLRVSFLNTPLLKITLPGTEPLRRSPESEEERARRITRDTSLFQRRNEDLRKAIRASQLFGVDKVRVFTFHRVREPEPLLPRIAEILAEMAEIAGREQVRLLVENEGSCNVTTCAEVAELLKLLPSRWIGVNWDALNGTSQNEVPFPDGYRLLPVARTGNVQIKGRSLLDGPQRLDWAAIFRALGEDGYDGCVGLETHTPRESRIQDSHTCMREILRIMGVS